MEKLKWIKLEGGSMVPVLRPGQIVPVVSGAYNTGDIVAYSAADNMYVHRMMGRDSGRVFMKDDAGISEGHWVPEEDILGKLADPHLGGGAGCIWNLIIRRIHLIKRGFRKKFF